MSERPKRENPYLPIAVGFFLLAIPMIVALFLVEDGRTTIAVVAAVMLFFGLILSWRRA